MTIRRIQENFGKRTETALPPTRKDSNGVHVDNLQPNKPYVIQIAGLDQWVVYPTDDQGTLTIPFS